MFVCWDSGDAGAGHSPQVMRMDGGEWRGGEGGGDPVLSDQLSRWR